MKPVLFEGHDGVLGARAGWDATKQGECVGLPVMREKDRFISQWAATPEERAALAGGAHVYLSVIGDSHPPVSLIVGRPSEPTDTIDVVILGGRGPGDTYVVDRRANRLIANVARIEIVADVEAARFASARLEILGEDVEYGFDVPHPAIGFFCTARIIRRAPA